MALTYFKRRTLFRQDTRNSLLLAIYLVSLFLGQLALLQRFSEYFLMIPLALSFSPLLVDKGVKIKWWSLVLMAFVAVICFFRHRWGLSFLYFIGAPIFAQYLIRNSFNLRIVAIVFWILIIYMLMYSVSGNASTLFVGSRNYVNVCAIFITIVYTFLVYTQEKKIVIVPSILTFLLCVFANGRGGLVSSLVLLVGLILVRLHEVKKKNLRYVSVFCVILVAIFAYQYVLNIYETSYVFERVRDKGLDDNARSMLWIDYLDHLDFSNILFGYDYSDNFLFQAFRSNPHNSYIKMHSIAGIFFLIPISLFVYSVVFSIIKKKWFYVVLVGCMLLRAYTDTILMNYYDFILYATCFLSLKNEKNIQDSI